MIETVSMLRNRSKTQNGLIFAAILLSFLVRLHGLSERTFWLDEGLTLWQMRQSFEIVWRGIIEVQGVPTQNTHPPLYFLLLWVARHLIGMTPFAVRFFSVWWGTIAVAAVGGLGSRLGGRPAGMLAAFLAAFSPLYLWYAQEARMYTMLVALSALSLYWLARLVEHPTVRTFGAYALATAAMMWTHYSSLFLVAAQSIVVGLALLRRRPRLVAAVMASVALGVAPFVPFLVRRFLYGVERDFFFVPLRIMARDLWHGFTVGISLPVTVSWPVEVVALVCVLAGAVWAGRRTASLFVTCHPVFASVTWLFLLIGPVLALYIAGHVKPLYQGVRHLMVISSTFYALAGCGLAALSRRHRVARGAAWVLLGAWSVGLALSTWNYFYAPTYRKDDTRGLFAYIAEYFRPGDIVVLRDPVFSHMLEYEQPELPWTALPHYGMSSAQPETRRHFEELRAQFERVWLVFSPADRHVDPDRLVDRWFAKEGFPLDVRRFHGQTTELGVLYYDLHGALAPEPQPMTDRINAAYSNGVVLLGARVPSREVAAGNRFFFDLVWETRRQPEQDFKVSVRLQAPDGAVWAVEDQIPFPQVHPPSHWMPNGYRRSPHSVKVPVGTPPGVYTVKLVLYEAQTGEPVPRGDGGEGEISLGQITVHAAPPPARWEPPVRLTGVVGGRLALLGAEAWPQKVQVGDSPAFAFYVKLLSPQAAEARLIAELVAPNGEVAFAADGPLFPPFANASAVPAGTVIQARRHLTVPPAGPPGRYTVRLRFTSPDGTALSAQKWWVWKTETIRVGTLTVEDRSRRFDIPPGGRAVNVRWNQGLRLVSAAWPEHVAPGATFKLNLVWQGEGPTDQSYKVFVHLRDERGQIVAQADKYPLGGRAPTNGWLPGEVVVDEYTLSVPSDLSPGIYTLVVGWYEEAGGRRLERVDGGDEALLGAVEVR